MTLGEVTRGEVDLVHIQKLNSLLDMRAAAEKRDVDKASRR